MFPPKRIEPSAGQESVWDYPRPPRVEPTSKHIRIVFNGETIVDTSHAIRILETSHPPVYYIPPADIRMEYFSSTSRSTFCEFKGAASYWTIRLSGRVAENVAWSYRQPAAGYEAIGCASRRSELRKSETRNSKVEATPQSKGSKTTNGSSPVLIIRICGFGFVSDFELRISDLLSVRCFFVGLVLRRRAQCRRPAHGRRRGARGHSRAVAERERRRRISLRRHASRRSLCTRAHR